MNIFMRIFCPMCGIVGYLESTPRGNKGEVEAVVRTMAASLNHRGPDDEGIWVNVDCGIALGHRRLSIMDLSVEGHHIITSS